MQEPAFPSNETDRLKSLQSLNVLDTPSEERFDRLTRLAKRMFNVPIALVSLVDSNRQWFKSCIGLTVGETPRDISFCGHAILGDDIFLINDTLKDDRFADNPLVLENPFIRFYAGCPLRHEDGSKLGTLCIIDTQPREFTQDDLAALKDLAEFTEHELIAVQLAALDDLTKIYNRRGFISLAQKQLELSAQKNIQTSLIFFDLNKFKAINDNFGHAIGDQALIAFADAMKNTFSPSDICGRLGGDEFVVLITNTESESVEETINRFKTAIASHNFNKPEGYELSYSQGALNIDYEMDFSLDTLLSQADSLMYKNKTNLK